MKIVFGIIYFCWFVTFFWFRVYYLILLFFIFFLLPFFILNIIFMVMLSFCHIFFSIFSCGNIENMLDDLNTAFSTTQSVSLADWLADWLAAALLNRGCLLGWGFRGRWVELIWLLEHQQPCWVIWLYGWFKLTNCLFFHFFPLTAAAAFDLKMNCVYRSEEI